jgi:hypothetical protein
MQFNLKVVHFLMRTSLPSMRKHDFFLYFLCLKMRVWLESLLLLFFFNPLLSQ